MKTKIQILLVSVIIAFGITHASAVAILNTNINQTLNSNWAAMPMGGSPQATAAGGGAGYPVDIFVRGGFNDWGLDDMMAFDGVLYSVDIALDVGSYEFKVASEDWATVDLGAGDLGDPTVLLDTARLIGPGPFGNLLLDITMAGLYSFTLDLSTGPNSPTLLVSAVTAVSEPASIALLGLAMLGFALGRRRRT